MKIGMIVFANNSGLAAQTRRLVEMVRPQRLLIIDSTPFSKNKEQHLDWYDGYESIVTHGFPKNHEIFRFVDGLTHVFSCENPYNFYLLYLCNQRGIKSYIQSNYEFCENLNNPHLPLPTSFLMPSYWMFDDMVHRFGEDRVMYLPPPIDAKEFADAAKKNLSRKGKKRFLHVVGTLAFKDRNGTVDLLNAMKFSKGDYELVITSQHELPEKYKSSDPRVKFEIGNKERNEDLYMDFDALILPRRYGGLSLTTNEALMSAMVIVMPDISPNHELLDNEWLVPAEKKTVIHAREIIDVYGVDPQRLAAKMDKLAEADIRMDKVASYVLGLREFGMNNLQSKYEQLWT